MNKEDIQKAIFAFRFTCKYNSILKKLDGTSEVYECFAHDSEKRGYRCDGTCKRLKRFIQILKEPK
ncbi:MAG: hypothetical protein ACLTZT_00125 [Butyricimonas faecalis]|jgi:hypothetical protein|uniref:hypothetical protein n=1 Tax=Butyricimonas faecalis TaxID=2093856 RepID=UPI003A2E4F0B